MNFGLVLVIKYASSTGVVVCYIVKVELLTDIVFIVVCCANFTLLVGEFVVHMCT